MGKTGAAGAKGATSPLGPDFLSIAEASQDCIWLLTPDGRVEYMNGRGRALVGAEGSGGPLQTWKTLWPEESRFSLERAVRTGATGQVAKFRAFFPGALQARRYWDTVVSPVLAEDGSVVRLFATSRDVTAEVETCAFLDSVIQLLPSPLTVKNVDDGRYILINRAAEDVLDVSADEALGKRASEILSPSMAESMAAAERAVAASGEMRVLEQAVLSPGADTPRHFVFKTRATFDDVGPRHLITLGEDVTERRAAAESLRTALVAAEQASEAKSAFLANISHEIRTPLNGIIAGADLLAADILGDRSRRLVDIILASSDSLNRLLSDILDLARAEAGEVGIEQAVFHAGDVIRSVAALTQLRAAAKGIALEVCVSPEMDGPAVGDSVRLRQVLANLLENAVKFTDHGGVQLTAARTPDGWARFCVVDTGIGFDPAAKERVFGRFRQADETATRRYGGSGLGLAIAREIVTRMGGSLDCDSTPGSGSAFWFEVPLPQQTDTESSDHPAGAPALRTNMRVLLADDHPTNRTLVELMLADDADIVSVEDGLQAVDAFSNGAFELVLMDIQMPVMDGLTAVRRIRDLEVQAGRAPTPIVMITANARPEDVAASRAAGADRHLQKPITAHALFTAIEDVLTSDLTQSNQPATGRGVG